MALLHQLLQNGYKKLIVCHLNHQLRGRAAAADARFVERISREEGLTCELGATDVRVLARQTRISIETASRIARYAFFFSVARRKRCRTIFLAHHADDLVETALLNFFRGASPGGIAAMRSVSVHRVGKSELTVVRPLLHVWRRDIDLYVKRYGLAFREDATNAQRGPIRNRIRHLILPHIEKQFGRDVRFAIWRSAQIWREEDDVLESMLELDSFNAPEIEVNVLRRLPLALQRRAIVHWLRAHRIADVGFELVAKVLGLIEPSSQIAKVNLPRNRHARRRAGKIFME